MLDRHRPRFGWQGGPSITAARETKASRLGNVSMQSALACGEIRHSTNQSTETGASHRSLYAVSSCTGSPANRSALAQMFLCDSGKRSVRSEPTCASSVAPERQTVVEPSHGKVSARIIIPLCLASLVRKALERVEKTRDALEGNHPGVGRRCGIRGRGPS